MENPGFHNSEKDITKNGISKIGDPSKEDQSCKLKVEEGITFSWSNLSVSTRPRKGGSCFGLIKSDDIPSKPILRDVSGIVRPGELLAIMGASGAGKSTLLNTLLFRNLGDLKLGYVQQDDLFFGTLTVQEHLTFQAMVRMDKEIPMWKRMERVEEVMKEVGLYKSKDTVIGIPGRINKYIVLTNPPLLFCNKPTICLGSNQPSSTILYYSVINQLYVQVLTNPPLLFCDEPTSGLDSFMAASVMDMMMKLAKQGRTVICTIHQPASQLFNKFDRLLLLAEGRTAYLGDAKDASRFFNNCNFPCPLTYNPADHFIEVLAIQPGHEIACRETVANICHAFDQSEEGKQLMLEVNKEDQVVNDTENMRVNDRSPYKASWTAQFSALSWRTYRALIKEPLIIKIRITQAIFISILLGVIYYGQEHDQSGVKNITGALFILLTNMSFGNIFAVVNVFCAELPIFLREHFNGMYRIDTYFLTKQLVDLPLFIVEPTIFLTILYFMVGLERTPEQFFFALGIVLLVVQVVISLGYFLSCVAPNVNIALAIGPVIIIPVMLFGGFFLDTSNVGWLVWMKYLSWFNYAYSTLIINQWSGVTNITCELPPKPCGFTTGEEIIGFYGFDEVDTLFNILMLVTLSVGLRILAFISLYIRSRKK
ncbi:protein white [Eurytemora carolleeae]|uniref:protein white n=1 Tax=Eurytemora carolleeae TaxID=1294199 RepID=UPI000C76F732|nr:protein white [Eurytemora carolleeae]|eukprot:XP_023332555.1 protein white-like [Eurytemora affinis]